MDLKELYAKVDVIARAEIDKYGLPTILHYELSIEQAEILADKLGADSDLCKIGAVLMDLKLGQAFAEKKLQEHVVMSYDSSKEILDKLKIQRDIQEKLLNCVEAHHGTKEFKCIEAEICANADCYRFLHPKGVLSYFRTLVSRLDNMEKEIMQVENKMEEKMAIVTIPIVVEELSKYYQTFKNYFGSLK